MSAADNNFQSSPKKSNFFGGLPLAPIHLVNARRGRFNIHSYQQTMAQRPKWLPIAKKPHPLFLTLGKLERARHSKSKRTYWPQHACYCHKKEMHLQIPRLEHKSVSNTNSSLSTCISRMQEAEDSQRNANGQVLD